MKMTGEQRIAAPRQRVWDALNDAEVLKRCIPGCQSLDKESAERMKAVAEIKIGPIGARFTGAVTLSELDSPNGYTITGEGQGGTAGFAKGGAKVRLSDDGGATLLSYEVDAQVGGRLAQLGGPLIDSTAKQLAGTFFKRFGEIVAPAAPATQPAAATAGAAPGPTPTPRAPAASQSAGPPMAWILAVVVAVLAGYLIGHSGQGGGEWMGLAIGLLVVIVAGAGFEFGRRAAAPLVVLDPALLARLANSSDEAKP